MSPRRRKSVARGDSPPKRTFTVSEADRALVLVRRIVADVMQGYARLLDLQEALEAAEANRAAQRCEEARLELIRTAGRLRTWVEELEAVGVELKDWALGVVDFPCVAGGRNVCLCWQHGQQRVEYWHDVGAGFAGRQPIATLPGEGDYVGAAGSGETVAAGRSAPAGAPRQRGPKR